MVIEPSKVEVSNGKDTDFINYSTIFPTKTAKPLYHPTIKAYFCLNNFLRKALW